MHLPMQKGIQNNLVDNASNKRFLYIYKYELYTLLLRISLNIKIFLISMSIGSSGCIMYDKRHLKTFGL